MNEVVMLSDSYKRHSKEGQYITNEGITITHTIQIDKNTKIIFKDFELWRDNNVELPKINNQGNIETLLTSSELNLFVNKLKAINDDLKGGINIERLGKSIANERGIYLK